ncbi:hypothetical protein [Sinorhizobium fredii]|uniref:hypothetical protein n=1 Tax=Rhizobium fredii TaxID=380 RepID=UPI003518A04F
MPNAPVQADGQAMPVEMMTRRAIEDHIERLIALLDEIDDDENLEPYVGGWDYSVMDDREGDDEREWDPAEMGIADLDALAEQAPFFYFNAHAL